MSAESIFNTPPTDRDKAALSRIAARQAAGDDSDIDYSDIPALTAEQLLSARRPAKKLVAVRLDTDVLEGLQQYGEGYSTRINTILRAVMSKSH